MPAGYDIYCGEVIDSRQERTTGLLKRNYLYSEIHILRGEPQHLSYCYNIQHLSCRSLFGSDLPFSEADLKKELKLLTYTNRMMLGRGYAELYLWTDGQKTESLMRLRQNVYGEYVLWHDRPSAVAYHYGNTLDQFRTAASETLHWYAREKALREGCGIPIAINAAGEATGASSYPLFAVRGKDVVTSPHSSGVAESIERHLAIEASAKAGYHISEEPLQESSLEDFEELFYATPSGITAIGRMDGRIYTSSAANAIAERMNHINI